MATSSQILASAGQPPLGAQRTSVDEKGRLKVTASGKRWLDRIANDEYALFVTSLDNESVHIFTLDEFASRMQRLEESTLTPLQKKAIRHTVYKNGSEGKCDKEGRVSIPVELRETVKLNTKDGAAGVYMQWLNGYFEVIPEAVFQKRDEELSAILPGALDEAQTARIF